MNPSTRLAIGLAGTGAVALVGAWAWARIKRWRRKDPAELERLRRLEVNRRGRITGGRIVDLVESESSERAARLLVYQYEVAGVTYEAAQDVGPLPEIAAVAQHLPGQTASVKYDPKKPTNSIVACEEWCGVQLGAGGSNSEVKDVDSVVPSQSGFRSR